MVPGLLSHLPAEVRDIDVEHPAYAPIGSLFDFALLNDSQPSRSFVDALTVAVLADVSQAEARGLLEEQDAAATRLCVAVRAMEAARHQSDLEGVWTWVMRGLGADAGPTTTFDTTGVVVLLKAAYGGDKFAEDTLAALASLLFYTDHYAGYFPELLEQVADPLIVVLLFSSASPVVVEGVCAALAWCRHNGRDEDVQRLGRWCDLAARRLVDMELRTSLRFHAGLALDGAERAEAMASLLADLSPRVSENMRLHVLVAAVEHDTAATVSAVPELVRLIRNSWGGASPSQRERSFSTIGPVLSRLADTGRVNAAIRVLRAWLAIPDLPHPPALLLSHRAEGAHYAWEGGVYQAPKSHTDEQLTAVVNGALGQGLASSVPGSAPLTGPATGLVDRAVGPLFAARTAAALGLASCPEIAEHLPEEALLVPLPGLPIPYQALLLAETDQAAPALWVSLESPLPDPFFDRALLLVGDTQLSSVEADLVSCVLSGAGMTVERLSGDEVTVASFRAAYAASDFDALWLSCHGRQPPYHPDHAELELRAGQHVTLEDLSARPVIRDTSRLLMLSSCDGAATATAGGPRRRGLAAQAAAGNQVVVSHQWRVGEGFAAAFSVLLACGLAESRSAVQAFNYALKTVRLPWPHVAAAMTGHGCRQDLVDRLRAPTGSYGHNILDHGAPALYR